MASPLEQARGEVDQADVVVDAHATHRLPGELDDQGDVYALLEQLAVVAGLGPELGATDECKGSAHAPILPAASAMACPRDPNAPERPLRVDSYPPVTYGS